MEDYKVVHNESESRFEVELNSFISEADYIISDGYIVVTHTGVPRELEGKGIAAAITKALLDYARKSGLLVKPVCSYTASYMQRHPEYQDLVQK